MHRALPDDLITAYDFGYASIDPSRVVRSNPAMLHPRTPAWGATSLKLHIGWLNAQLRGDPSNGFSHGRRDALHDLLARIEPLEH